jgi:hypothetical protein
MAKNTFSIRNKTKFEVRRYIFVTLFLVYVGVTFVSLILKAEYLKGKFSHTIENFDSIKRPGLLHRQKRDHSNYTKSFETGNIFKLFLHFIANLKTKQVRLVLYFLLYEFCRSIFRL